MRRLPRLLRSVANIRSFLYFGDVNGKGYPGAGLLWRWLFNFRRSLLHEWQDGANRERAKQVAVLRQEGILVQPFDGVFDKNGTVALDAILEACKAKMAEPYVCETLNGTRTGGSRKDFILELLDKRFDLESPFIQLAVNRKLLALVNEYLGMRSYLRDVQVWLNYPTAGPPKETQLWHRDYADFLNVKVFIYLNEVTRQNGPFCFVPQTHRIGSLRKVPVRNAKDRIGDQEMGGAISPEHWKICLGPCRTVVLCDTGGFHRGLKPVDSHRVLLELHYTSGTPAYPRTFSLEKSDAVFARFDAIQRYALLL